VQVSILCAPADLRVAPRRGLRDERQWTVVSGRDRERDESDTAHRQ